jgi:subtilisin-like proprotein convertase family protein
MKRTIWIPLLLAALVLAACGAPTPPVTSRTFSNTAVITIPGDGSATSGPAAPYPSAIVVDDMPAVMSTVTVRLNGLSHEWPADLDVLLVGPGGEHALLMSDAGGSAEITNVTLIFDAAAAEPVPNVGPLASGTYQPTNYGDGDTFDAPAPAGPYAPDLGVFDGTDPNGTWLLFIDDDTGADVGAISGGWSLTFALD